MTENLPNGNLSEEQTDELIDITLPTLEKKKNFLQEAAKPFKGKRKIEDLVEEFTEEVSLVTEGLWNDQKKIRDQMNNMLMEQSLWGKKEEDARISLADEIAGLIKKTSELEDKIRQLEVKKKKEKSGRGTLFQISLIVFAITGAWVLVTLINALIR